MKTLSLLAICAGLSLSACAHQVQVSHQGPATLDGSRRTYAVVTHEVGTSLSTNNVFQQRVHDAMAAKGYTLASSPAEADLLVSFKALKGGASKGQTAGATATGTNIGLGGTGDAESVSKVIMVQVTDAKTSRVMWVGWSTGKYPDHEFVRRTDESIEKILALIPARG